MKKQTQNRFVAGLILGTAFLVYLWTYPLNQGWVEVATGLPGYRLSASSQAIDCVADPCRIKLKSGLAELRIQKDGYFPLTTQATAKRMATVRLPVELKRIPGLEEAAAEPPAITATPVTPKAVDEMNPVGSAWSMDRSTLAFWDPKDQRLKKWTTGKGVEPIAFLKGMPESLSISWSTDGRTLAVFANMDLYWIDILSASRKKRSLDFTPGHPTWSAQGDRLWVNGEGLSVYELGSENLAPEKVGLEVDLSNGVWLADGKFVYYSTDEKTNRTAIDRFDPATGQVEEVVGKYDFPVSAIRADGEGSVFFLNPKENRWYRLRF